MCVCVSVFVKSSLWKHTQHRCIYLKVFCPQPYHKHKNKFIMLYILTQLHIYIKYGEPSQTSKYILTYSICTIMKTTYIVNNTMRTITFTCFNWNSTDSATPFIFLGYTVDIKWYTSHYLSITHTQHACLQTLMVHSVLDLVKSKKQNEWQCGDMKHTIRTVKDATVT